MARKRLLHKYLPKPHELKDKKIFKLLGERLFDGNLWHLNRRSASFSGFIGCFFAMMPIPGQTVLAALCAILLRSNLPLAIALVWITNPLTMVPVFYAIYLLGCWLLNMPVIINHIHPDKDWLIHHLISPDIWVPLAVGSLTAGIALGTIAFISISQIWKWQVIRRWEKRKCRIQQIAAEKNNSDNLP